MKPLALLLLIAGVIGMLVAGGAAAQLRIGMATGDIPDGPLQFIAATPWLLFGLFGASPTCLLAGVILHGRRPPSDPEPEAKAAEGR